ncbi:hypothetical protein L1049_012217 [Liquidambar formosana]|uniref:Uncharacterized protein n=1 Tax=Liquidambar formosana TaxID=63359 RepID=A0AAP0WXI7_LIQFO
MARESSDPTVVGSSIALLQERFRRLERVRERREEKEVLELFSEPERINPSYPTTMSFEPPKLSFLPPKPPPLQDSLSLGLNSLTKHADFRAIKTTPLINLRSTTGAAIVSMRTSNSYENSDVDTSLHL